MTSGQNQLTSGFHRGQNGEGQNPGDIWDKKPFLLGFCDLLVDFLSRLDQKVDPKSKRNCVADFTLQFLNDKTDQNTNFDKLLSAK